MRIIGVLALSLLWTCVATAPALAQRGDRGGMGRGMLQRDLSRGFGAQFLERLDLTEEQKAKIEELNEAFRRDNADVLERMGKMRGDLQKRTEGNRQPTQEEIQSLNSYYGNPMRQLFPAFRRLREGVMSVLTDEQREQLQAMMGERRRRRP